MFAIGFNWFCCHGSGDLDLIFPFIGTEAWVRSLNYTILDDWRSWWVDQQVAG